MRHTPTALATILAIVMFCSSAAGRLGPSDEQIAARNDRPADTRLFIPRLDKAPTCDGTIAPDEWTAATTIPVSLNLETGNLFPRRIVWRVGWDGRALYVSASTPILRDEELNTEVPPQGKPDLTKNDSYEVHVVDDEGRTRRVVLNAVSMATWETRAARPDAAFAPWKPQATAAATRGESFDAEFALPWRELGIRPRAGANLRVLLVRNYRCGVSMASPIPAQSDKGDAYALLTLAPDATAVRLESPVERLYGAGVEAVVDVRAGKAVKAPLAVALSVVNTEDGESYYEASREIASSEAGAAKVSLAGMAKPRIDIHGKGGVPFLYALTIRDADGSELLHLRFPYDPTEHRPWLVDAIPGVGRGLYREIILDPTKPAPAHFQRYMSLYEDLPAGHRVRLTVRRIFEPSKRHEIDAPQRIAAINAEGVKDGIEAYYGKYGYDLKKTVTYRDGVRHGPEKLYATADRRRYAKTVIPWVDGVVSGMRRVYHPNGQVMVEVKYENGRPVGTSTTCDETGRIVRTTEYADGARDGEMIDYYPRKPKRIAPFENGQVNGVVREFYESGKLRSETPFRRDELHGVEKHYDENGEVTRTRYWLEGEMVPEGEFRQKYRPEPAAAKAK